MMKHAAGFKVVVLALAVSLGLVFAGCGEKIALPEASGNYNINQYGFVDSLAVGGTAVQVTNFGEFLYVLTVDSLSRYDAGLNLDRQVALSDGPTAICGDTESDLIFVWEDGSKRVTWFDPITLDVIGDIVLSGVSGVTAMTVNRRGADLAAAEAYLYLSDPAGEVIHRYAFNSSGGLTPFGILTNSDGAGTRFVYDPAGLTTDGEGYLLVCDADSSRNWVTRFHGTPDTTDTAVNPGDPDPMRSLAALFNGSTCPITPAAADYVIGDAAECEESDWVGGPSDADGEFANQRDVAVDLSGRIFVADSGNHRVQLFNGLGEFITFFSTVELLAQPMSLAIIPGTTNEGDIVFGAYVVMTLKDRDHIYRFISKEYDDILNEEEYSD